MSMGSVSLLIATFKSKRRWYPKQIESGSNMEAVLDLIESYSFQKWGAIKPHVISEFGGIAGSTYSDINNVQSIRSQNAMLFGLLQRQDVTELTIPFTTGKSTWHITEANNYKPYKAVLFKPVPFGVPLDQVTRWEYTEIAYASNELDKLTRAPLNTSFASVAEPIRCL